MFTREGTSFLAKYRTFGLFAAGVDDRKCRYLFSARNPAVPLRFPPHPFIPPFVLLILAYGLARAGEIILHAFVLVTSQYVRQFHPLRRYGEIRIQREGAPEASINREKLCFAMHKKRNVSEKAIYNRGGRRYPQDVETNYETLEGGELEVLSRKVT